MRNRLRRCFRRLGWDRNPLRRPADHAEKWLITSLLGLFLIAAPVVAVVAWHLAGGSALRQQRAERSWHQVTATVLQVAPGQIGPYEGGWGVTVVSAQWTAPAGTRRTGLVAAASSAQAGSQLRVWVNSAGQLMDARLSRRGVQLRVAVATVTAPLILALVLCLVAGTGRLLLDHRRLAGWERAWRVVGPRWAQLR